MSELAKALSAAQAEFPMVEKNRTANVGSYSYKYADLTDVIEAIKPILAKNGLSFLQPYQIVNGQQVLETQLRHAGGEVITSHLMMPNPDKMKPQDVGTISTYFKRYALCSMLGISADEDTDAAPKDPKGSAGAQNGPKAASSPSLGPGNRKEVILTPKPITAAQIARLMKLAQIAGLPEIGLKEIVKRHGFSSRKDIMMDKYDAICQEVERWQA